MPKNAFVSLSTIPLSDDTTPDGIVWPSRIADILRAGFCPSDAVFDRFLPSNLRAVSRQHWTPLEVAVRAGEWIDQFDIRTVVDIGSGAGKFCVAAALASRATFVGLEQRARLISAASELAQTFDVADRVTFVHATLGLTPLPPAEAYYLYNPFGENLFGAESRLDEEVELGYSRYVRDVATVRELLRRAPVDTYLITYNGFGGRIPMDYRNLRVDRELPNVLGLWRKITMVSHYDRPNPDWPFSS
jgi:hypothetical protein